MEPMMARPDPKEPGIGQEELFPDVIERVGTSQAGSVLRGRHSRAVDEALAAAVERDLVEDVDMAAASLLRAGAWALDSFEASNKPYGPSKLIPALTEALRELRMTPDARDTDTDSKIDALLADFGRLDSDGDAPVSDPAH